MLSPLNHDAIQRPRRTFTVIFADKAQALTDHTWNIAVLAAAAHRATGVADAKESMPQADADNSVLFFDGSPAGELPASWADNQHQTVVRALQRLLQNPQPITLNCFGAGSGGISALRLAASVGKMSKTSLEVNLLLLDPVLENPPKPFPDVSASGNLGRVLSLYATVRSDQVPVFPDYPVSCDVSEEVCPGLHADIQKMDQEVGQLAYLRSLLFLKNCGTPFCSYIPFGDRHFLADREILDLENDLSERYQFFVRCGEGVVTEDRREGRAKRRQAYITVERSAAYLNPHHRALTKGARDDEACILGIRKTPLWHFFLRQAALWLLVGIATACFLQLAGVLVLVPALQTLSPVLYGLTSVSALSLLCFAVWHGIARPLTRYLFTSPNCEIRLPEVMPQGTYRSHFAPQGLLRAGDREPSMVPTVLSEHVRAELSVHNVSPRESATQENRSSLRPV